MSENVLVALMGFFGVAVGALFTWLATHERIASEAADRHQATEDRVFERIDKDNLRLRDEIAALKASHAAEVAELRDELTAVKRELSAVGAAFQDASKQVELLKVGVKRLLAQMKRLGIVPDWTPPPGLDHEVNGNGK